MGRPAASKRPWRGGLRIAAVLAGLALIGASGGLVARHWAAPPVYQYVMGEAVTASELGPLEPLAQQQVTVRRATIVSPDHASPLAELELAESASGPVLVGWQARVDDPFLTLPVAAQDVAALAAVLKRHVPADQVVLGWWDTSRQFKLLAGVNVAFGQHLGTPLFVPPQWRGERKQIESIERAFWQGREARNDALTEDQERFQRFADALLAPEQQGMAQLQAIAGGKPAVLVLHLRDMVLLGHMAPQKLGIAFQDFGGAGDVHGMVRGVRAWMSERKYAAYSLLPGKDQSVRAIALTDESSGHTLAARLLPFIGNDQSDVARATLVYQVGGFSVFEIAPTQVAAAPSSEERKP